MVLTESITAHWIKIYLQCLQKYIDLIVNCFCIHEHVADISEVTGKEQTEVQQPKKGRGRKQ